MAKEKSKYRYEKGTVPTAVETVYVDTETEEQLDLHNLLLRMANDIEELKIKLL